MVIKGKWRPRIRSPEGGRRRATIWGFFAALVFEEEVGAGPLAVVHLQGIEEGSGTEVGGEGGVVAPDKKLRRRERDGS